MKQVIEALQHAESRARVHAETYRNLAKAGYDPIANRASAKEEDFFADLYKRALDSAKAEWVQQ